jgi:hypothetical protein
MLCLLIPAFASAQQTQKPRKAQNARTSQSAALPAAAYPVQHPAANWLIGRYYSDAFFPSTLTLTISGIDQHGNLSGTMWGWRSSWEGGETGDKWVTWHRTFGQDARAVYGNGRINVTFANGTTYVLDTQDGYRLTGQFAAENERIPIVFQKAPSFMAAR